MKFESNFHGSRKIIFFLLIFLFLHPCLVFSEETYKSYFEKAQSFDKDDFFEDAIEYWQKTLDANPPSNIALYVQLKLAHTYSRLGRLDKAATISKTLTQTNPDNYDSWFHLASRP
jgi:tetratricopeptide (TPR) repeat protein